MKLCNNIRRILPWLILAVLLASAVNAALDNALKTGTTNYFEAWNGGFLQGTIDWAVYDSTETYFDTLGFEAPGSGSVDDYVYVYLINNNNMSDSVIAYFSILGLDETNVSGQTYEDYPSGGAEPSTQYLDETEGAVWKWSSDNGYILQDGSSWMLVLRSEYGPEVKEYVFKGPDEGDPLEGPEVPEPTTVALLGVGGAYLLRRKRKKADLT